MQTMRPEDAAQRWLNLETKTNRCTIPVTADAPGARRSPHGNHYVTMLRVSGWAGDLRVVVVIDAATGERIAARPK